jgi:hypothetical protein
VARCPVAAARSVWIDLVPRGAFPEERRDDSGRFLGRDAPAGIFRVALRAADLRVSAHWERPPRARTKMLPDALQPAVVPAMLPERMAAGSGSQFSAR